MYHIKSMNLTGISCSLHNHNQYNLSIPIYMRHNNFLRDIFRDQEIEALTS